MDWNGQQIVVIGAARQGIALTRFLVEHGAHVTLNDYKPFDALMDARQVLADLTDSRAIKWVCGGHPLSLLDDVDLVCPSGGVPLTLPLIVEAQKRGIALSNDSQIFMQAVPCPVIGITGSAGKTTTTTLVGRIAHAAVNQSLPGFADRKIWVGGNIGVPLISYLDQMQPDDLVIMELSSFQLEIMSSSPDVAAVLNITPNHLDRHGSMRAYTDAKRRILTFQSADSSAVLGHDDPGAWALASYVEGQLFSFGFSSPPTGGPGVYLEENKMHIRSLDGIEKPLMDLDTIMLRGAHNTLNVMAACAIALAGGLPENAMSAGVQGFTGVHHRLEFIRSWGGADWYNDSIATAPERAMAAIRSFDEPLVLLAGGRDKNLPWDELAKLIRQRVDHLVLFGEAADIIHQAVVALGNGSFTLTKCASLKEAVLAAAELAQPGDVVLLSPGGTSFDEFIDFEERGICFAQWVNQLP